MVGPTVTGYHALALVHAVAGAHSVAGVSTVVGSTVTGYHALALVHAVAGAHSVAGISTVVGSTVTGYHALALVHAVAGTHAVAGVSTVVGSTVTGYHALALVYVVAGTLLVFLFILFIFYINRAYNILYVILVECRSCSPHCFRSVEGQQWGAEPRFELGPAVQQADALLSEPRRTLRATQHHKATPHPCFCCCWP